jgi:hypothetical protein
VAVVAFHQPKGAGDDGCHEAEYDGGAYLGHAATPSHVDRSAIGSPALPVGLCIR